MSWFVGWLSVVFVTLIGFPLLLQPTTSFAGDAVPVEDVRIAIPAMPRTLIPKKLLDSIAFNVIRYLHEPLFRFDNKNGFSSNVLSSWRVSIDGREYSFTIKNNVTFHDGAPVTAKDVIFSLQECRKIRACALSYIPEDIRFVYISPSEFRILLEAPNSILLYTLLDQKASIVPNRLGAKSEEYYEKHPIGLGAYKLFRRSDRELALERFDGYSGHRSENKQITFVLIRNVEHLIAENIEHPLHEINQLVPVLSGESLKQFLDASNFKEIYFPFLNTNVIFMNFKSGLFNDLWFRKFLFILLRGSEFVDAVSPTASGEKATGFISKGMLGHLSDDDVVGIEQPNIDESYRKISGLQHPTTLSFITYMDQNRSDKLQELLDNRLRPFPKIRILVKSLSKKDFYDRLFSAKYELALVMWQADHAHPFFYIEVFKSGSEYNFGHISDASIDRAFSSFHAATKEAIHNFCKGIDKEIMEKALLIPVSYSTGRYFYPENLLNYELSIMGVALFDHSNTKEIR